MAKSLDELVDRLLDEIALDGDRGKNWPSFSSGMSVKAPKIQIQLNGSVVVLLLHCHEFSVSNSGILHISFPSILMVDSAHFVRQTLRPD